MRIFLALLILLVARFCFADTYIITKPDKSVYSISNQDDAVVPQGYDKHVVKDKDPKDFNIGTDTTLYDYKNGAFVVNGQRALKKQQDAQDEAVKAEKITNDKKSAIEKLKALGLTDDEIKTFLN